MYLRKSNLTGKIISYMFAIHLINIDKVDDFTSVVKTNLEAKSQFNTSK